MSRLFIEVRELIVMQFEFSEILLPAFQKLSRDSTNTVRSHRQVAPGQWPVRTRCQAAAVWPESRTG